MGLWTEIAQNQYLEVLEYFLRNLSLAYSNLSVPKLILQKESL